MQNPGWEIFYIPVLDTYVCEEYLSILCIYGARNLETVFLYYLNRLNDFIGQKCLKGGINLGFYENCHYWGPGFEPHLGQYFFSPQIIVEN